MISGNVIQTSTLTTSQANEEQIKNLEEKLKEMESSKDAKLKEIEDKNTQLEQNCKDFEGKRSVLETSLKVITYF